MRAVNLLWDNGYASVYQGDSRHLPLEDGTVDLVCTSPPYWGLRKYSGEQESVWGGDDHEHEWGGELVIKRGHPGDNAACITSP